jgi:hypothetical protein
MRLLLKKLIPAYIPLVPPTIPRTRRSSSPTVCIARGRGAWASTSTRARITLAWYSRV